jgi:hypothetical protein
VKALYWRKAAQLQQFNSKGVTKMTNYVLWFTGGGMPETEEEQAAVIEAWTNWYGELGQAVVDGGNPFTPMAKSIASDRTVSDGAVGVMGGGYTIIAADSMDAAVQMAKGCPHLDSGGDVTVYETFQVGPQ